MPNQQELPFGQVSQIISDFQKQLVPLGFSEEQIYTILTEVVLIASAKLSQEDLSFLSTEEIAFVSNGDLLKLKPETLKRVISARPNLSRYVEIYANALKESIHEFDQIVEDARKEETEEIPNNINSE
jgi:hypothetical protein